MVIFIYGADTYRSRRKLRELKEKFIRDIDPSGQSFVKVDGENATLEKVNEAIAPSSLFVRKRMVVVENIFLNKSQTIFSNILEYLKKDTDNIVIFFDGIASSEKLIKTKSELFNFLVKQKYSLPEFKLLSNTETTAWVKNEIENKGGRITREAAAALAAILGSDLWRVANEIEKLVNYKAGQKLDGNEQDFIINVSDVERMVKGAFDENIFGLTDAISAKNKDLALRLFEEQFRAGLTDFHLLNMITRQFKVLLQIRQAIEMGLTSNKMARDLGLHPFIIQKGVMQAKSFTLDNLKKIFSSLVEIDYKAKTGQSDIKTELSLLIANLEG